MPGGGEFGGYYSSGVVVADRVIGKVPLHARFALLRKYRGYIHIIGNARDKLAYKKDQKQRSVETLGLSGHGDVP